MIPVVQVCPLLSSLALCGCGHPEGQHAESHDVCWAHLPNGFACLCHRFQEAS